MWKKKKWPKVFKPLEGKITRPSQQELLGRQECGGRGNKLNWEKNKSEFKSITYNALKTTTIKSLNNKQKKQQQHMIFLTKQVNE